MSDMGKCVGDFFGLDASVKIGNRLQKLETSLILKNL